MNYAIQKNLLPASKRNTPLTLDSEIHFGQTPTDHMFVCDFDESKGGWQTPKIIPYGPFEIYPDTAVFHYGQEIFEGMKAYKNQKTKDIYLFRPEANAKRFQNSAARLGMAEVPTELFIQGIRELVDVDRSWALQDPGSLYIRPFLIATSRGVSYHAADKYRFMVILSPAKTYYTASKAVTVYVEKQYVRAVEGGVGATKCGGNYGGSLVAMKRAVNKGADQVLWLDAVEHQFVEEVGTMNVMFAYPGKKLLTPELSGSILPGITRDSLITLAESLGYTVIQERISIDKIAADIRSGSLTEVFGCGTAVVVSPVGKIMFDDEVLTINEGNPGNACQELRTALVSIQNGVAPDPHNWRVKV